MTRPPAVLRSEGRRVRWGVLLALAVACVPEPESPEFPQNQCVTSEDCWSDTACNTELGLCAAHAMEQPYTVVLQISPSTRDTRGRFTWPAMRLDSAPGAPIDLVVPPFVPVEGLLTCQGKPMTAEVVFYPRAQAGYPIAPVTVRSDGDDTADVTNLVTGLPPNTVFDVNIQPLGPDSALCPPQRTAFSVGTTAVRFDPPEPNLVELRGKLVEDRPASEVPPAAQKVQVRVRSKSLQRVVSATVPTQLGSLEEFVVNLLAIPQEDGVLQVDLDPSVPWTQVLEYPLPALGESSDVRVPIIPRPVTLAGGVEFHTKQAAPFTRLVFSSSFPLPAVSGGDLEWCQLRRQSGDPSQVSCFAERTVSTDQNGNYEVQLLPGKYDVLLLPGSHDAAGRRVNAAAARPRPGQTVWAQPNGNPQGPVLHTLPSGAEVEGVFENRDGKPLPNMQVRSTALAVSQNRDEISAYNRSARALTDARGQFALSFDSGVYDVVAEPPKSSGYAWLVITNREFDIEKSTYYSTQSTLPPPVVLRGVVRGGEAGRPMANATVEAYGIVTDVRKMGAVRPVLIGSTQSDEQGNYVLLLPPKLEEAKEMASP